MSSGGGQPPGFLPPQPGTKRQRVEAGTALPPPGSNIVTTAAPLPPGDAFLLPATPQAFNNTAPATGPRFAPVALPWAAPQAGGGGAPASPRAAASPRASASPRAPKDSRRSGLSAEEKLARIDIASGSAAALWQWLCVSILFSARIKSNAAMTACQALFEAGLTTPQAVSQAGQQKVRQLLADGGYGQYDDKAAGFLVDNARTLVQQYGGDLNRLRQAAANNASQERALLKKLKGTGDGAVDIFFRQVQVAWEEAFPFADKKALKAARLVGLKEHPQALAELCGNDRTKYAALLSALVRVDMVKAYSEF